MIEPCGKLMEAGLAAADSDPGRPPVSSWVPGRRYSCRLPHEFVAGFFGDLLAVSDGQQMEIAVIPAGVVARGSEDWKRLRRAP